MTEYCLYGDKRNEATNSSEWLTSKAQMSRDMRIILGIGWPHTPSGGGRGKGGGKRDAETALGLEITVNAASLLKLCRKPTVPISKIESNILNSTKDFEKRYGSSIITPALILYFETVEVLTSNCLTQTRIENITNPQKIKTVLSQLRSADNPR